MTDEAFYLTSLDARRFDFGRALRGYDPAKVEDFRSQVADELERLARANAALQEQTRVLHEQLRAFRQRDQALNDALVTAQQLRSEMRDQAERETQLILREARAEGERVLEASRTEARKLQMELAMLEQSRRTFLAQLRGIVERQMAEIAAAEAAVDRGDSSPDDEPRGPRSAWLPSLVKE